MTSDVHLVRYDPTWPERFAALASRLPAGLRVEHVGSTSVPGLCAQDCIDILVTDADPRGALDRLVAAGFEHRPGRFDGERFFLRLVRDGRRAAHLHLMAPDRPEAVSMLAVRDLLRRSASWRAAYGSVKTVAVQAFPADRGAYIEAKRPVVEALARAARLGGHVHLWEQPTWLPAGSRAVAVADDIGAAPAPAVIQRLLLVQGSRIFVVPSARGEDLPSRPVSAGGLPAVMRMVLGGEVPTRCVGHVHNLVLHPDASYPHPTPHAFVPVHSPVSDVEPAVAGRWARWDEPAFTERHWWPIVRALLRPTAHRDVERPADVRPAAVRPAREEDLGSWLDLAHQVEPLFGPMPGIEEHLRRGIARGTALAVGPPGTVDGAMLLSRDDRPHHITWLATREESRGVGIGGALVDAALERWPDGDVDVVTFTEDEPDGAAARRLYERHGFTCLGPTDPAPDGGRRDLFRRAR